MRIKGEPMVNTREERLEEGIGLPSPAVLVGEQHLSDWMAQPVGYLAVAPLSPKLREALGTPSRWILLSPDTYAKQAKRHAELTCEEYFAVIKHLEAGETFRDGAFRVVVINELGRWYKVVLKATAARDEVFLVALFRMDAKTLRKTRQLPGL